MVPRLWWRAALGMSWVMRVKVREVVHRGGLPRVGAQIDVGVRRRARVGENARRAAVGVPRGTAGIGPGCAAPRRRQCPVDHDLGGRGAARGAVPHEHDPVLQSSARGDVPVAETGEADVVRVRAALSHDLHVADLKARRAQGTSHETRLEHRENNAGPVRCAGAAGRGGGGDEGW